MNREDRRKASRLRVKGSAPAEYRQAQDRRTTADVVVDQEGGGVVTLHVPVGTDEWMSAVWDRLSPDQLTDGLRRLDQMDAVVTVVPWKG